MFHAAARARYDAAMPCTTIKRDPDQDAGFRPRRPNVYAGLPSIEPRLIMALR